MKLMIDIEIGVISIKVFVRFTFRWTCLVAQQCALHLNEFAPVVTFGGIRCSYVERLAELLNAQLEAVALSLKRDKRRFLAEDDRLQ